MVVGVFAFNNIGPTENGAFGALFLNDDAVSQVGWAELGNITDLSNATAFQMWKVDASVGTQIALQAKTGSTGSGHLNPDSTKLFALLVQPR